MGIKGYIKFFTVLFIIGAIFQMMPTFIGKYVESKAEKWAGQGVQLNAGSALSAGAKIGYEDSVNALLKQRKHYYLDSISNETILNLGFTKFDYRYCQEHQLKLGLDLKGGISMVLEIAEDEVLQSLSGGSRDVAFNKAIVDARNLQKSEQGDYLTLFEKSYSQANPNGKLAAIFGALPSYQGKINFGSSNSEVMKVLRTDVASAVQETYKVLKTRIDRYGVGSTNVSLQSNTGRIIVELPGVDDPTRIRKILQQTAQLEFWRTFETSEVVGAMVKADEALGAKLFNEKNGIKDSTATPDSTKTAGLDSLKKAPTAGKKDSSNLYPIRRLLAFNVNQQTGEPFEGAMVGYAMGKDTAKLNSYFNTDQARANFPRELKLMWSAKPIDEKKTTYGLYAIQYNPSVPEAPLSGDVITDAYKSFDQRGTPEVDISMNSMGSNKWEQLTDEAVNAKVNGKPTKKSIAIALDNMIFSCPRVQSKIAGGRSQITGMNSIEEAEDLSNILKSGKLKAKPRVIEEQIVGPSLGKEAINSGLLSLFAAFVIVMLFMIAYYSTSGIVAVIAVVLNLFFIIGVMAGLPGASLSLPGMAGIVLTLAIAIDANVIINERIREELNKGKGVLKAIEDGYRGSYSAIFDGNITTIIIGVILTAFGYGPVKGFAVTLLIGIFCSLFTAVGFSHVLFDWLVKRGTDLKFGNSFTMNLLRGLNYQFMAKRKFFYMLSLAVFILSFICMMTVGFDLGVDFKGGRSYVVKLDKDVKTGEIANVLEKQFGSRPLVKTYGSNNQIQITTAYLIDDKNPDIDTRVEAKLYEGINSFFAEKPTLENFKTKNVKSVMRVESSIADDIRRSALLSGFLGTLGIFIYIFFRFRKVEFAAGAVAALIHDPIIVLGLFSALRHIMPFSLEVDQNVVAAILTLIGYSVNDTVIVFDRIREYLKLYPTKPLVENVNDAINSTLSRTIMTSVAAELVIITLFLFGGDSIRQFSFAMMIGIAIGTYSSIFIASPIVVDMMLKRGTKS